MLNFNEEVQAILSKIRLDINQQEFIPVVYPETICEETWDFQTDEVKLPKTKGCIFFIYDENKNLLYIGKTKDLRFSLLSHLIRKTSKNVSSILDEVKKSVCYGKEKRMYLKVLNAHPVELGSAIKPYLIKEYQPLLSKRLS
ncbi:hypothetical protein LJB90_03535 [Eubacteriales bacterium OttesenSCG-928-G02]|nr:hypothetical protein [Eubacteriales bacterium OttesenSCG-928-G02]